MPRSASTYKASFKRGQTIYLFFPGGTEAGLGQANLPITARIDLHSVSISGSIPSPHSAAMLREKAQGRHFFRVHSWYFLNKAGENVWLRTVAVSGIAIFILYTTWYFKKARENVWLRTAAVSGIAIFILYTTSYF